MAESGGFPAELLRADLADFGGYSSARTSAPELTPAETIWLNANESGSANPADPGGSVRRYPDPQPADLVAALAELYRVEPDRIVVGRGSDEAIDLLIRAVCRPGADAIVTAPPTFGMYAVSARVHGSAVHPVAQREVNDDGDESRPGEWRTEVDAIAETVERTGARIVFVASPGNPTGAVIPRSDLDDLAGRLARRAVLVVDEAYQEFADVDGVPSALSLTGRHPNLVVLRTLSKAHALAAARVGVAVAHPDLAAVLRRVQAPYPIPAPVTAIALAALQPEASDITAARVTETVQRREALVPLLAGHPWVAQVYPSAANFLLIRATDAAAAAGLLTALQRAGIVVRDFRTAEGLQHALRVTIGSETETAALRAVLAATGSAKLGAKSSPKSSPELSAESTAASSTAATSNDPSERPR